MYFERVWVSIISFVGISTHRWLRLRIFRSLALFWFIEADAYWRFYVLQLGIQVFFLVTMPHGCLFLLLFTIFFDEILLLYICQLLEIGVFRDLMRITLTTELINIVNPHRYWLLLVVWLRDLKPISDNLVEIIVFSLNSFIYLDGWMNFKGEGFLSNQNNFWIYVSFCVIRQKSRL